MKKSANAYIKPRAALKVGVEAGGTWIRIAIKKDGKAVRRKRIRRDGGPLLAQLRSELSRIGPLQRLKVGAAGVWTPAERRQARNALRGLAREVVVMSDLELAWEAAFAGQPGILVVGGTGSAAYGRDGRNTARAGGLGPLLGDEGSAFWIGREWLRAQPDGRKARSYARKPDSTRAVAALARTVLRNAASDGQCRRIAKDAANHLAELAGQCARNLSISAPIPVAWRGGLFADPSFGRRFAAALGPRYRIHRWRTHPEVHAILVE